MGLAGHEVIISRTVVTAKNTLKYKRNRLPPLLDLVDRAIDVCLRVIERPDFKFTMSDLIRLVRLSLKLKPPNRGARSVQWFDKLKPDQLVPDQLKPDRLVPDQLKPGRLIPDSPAPG